MPVLVKLKVAIAEQVIRLSPHRVRRVSTKGAWMLLSVDFEVSDYAILVMLAQVEGITIEEEAARSLSSYIHWLLGDPAMN